MADCCVQIPVLVEWSICQPTLVRSDWAVDWSFFIFGKALSGFDFKQDFVRLCGHCQITKAEQFLSIPNRAGRHFAFGLGMAGLHESHVGPAVGSRVITAAGSPGTVPKGDRPGHACSHRSIGVADRDPGRSHVKEDRRESCCKVKPANRPHYHITATSFEHRDSMIA